MDSDGIARERGLPANGYRLAMGETSAEDLEGSMKRLKILVSMVAMKVVVWANKDSNYIKHVHEQVPEWFAEETVPNRWIADGTVELLAVFSSQMHSGGSSSFALMFFDHMARFKTWREI